MNSEHLSRDDADGVRDARRRRRPHRGHDVPDVPRPPPPRDGRGDRAHAASPRRSSARPSYGPREFFYADLFASRRTGCRSQLGLPGIRDQHSGLRRRLPGRARPVRLPPALPARQRHALAPPRARRAGDLARRRRPPARARHATPPAAPDAFLEDHAVIVCSDHSQSQVDAEIDLFAAFDGLRRAARRRRAREGDAEIAAVPELARGAGLRARPRPPRGAAPARRARRCSTTTASTS